MKLYLASSILNRSLVHYIGQELSKLNFIEIVSTWHNELGTEYINLSELESLKVRATIDFSDLDKADSIVVLYPYGETGTLQEMAYALAKNKFVFYVIPDGINDYPLITGLINRDNGKIVRTIEELIFYLRG